MGMVDIPNLRLGAKYLYSPSCREGIFSETHIPDAESLSNAIGGKPISSLCPGPVGHASCYAFGWIFTAGPGAEVARSSSPGVGRPPAPRSCPDLLGPPRVYL